MAPFYATTAADVENAIITMLNVAIAVADTEGLPEPATPDQQARVRKINEALNYALDAVLEACRP